ncbi:MAG: hypothetical protein WCA14_04365, partial [Steroidobacteraceae bacterium]
MPTINNPRVYLWVALAILLFYDYQSWQRDYPALGASSAPVATAGHAAAPAADLSNRLPSVPSTSTGATASAAAPAASAPEVAAATGP